MKVDSGLSHAHTVGRNAVTAKNTVKSSGVVAVVVLDEDRQRSLVYEVSYVQVGVGWGFTPF